MDTVQIFEIDSLLTAFSVGVVSSLHCVGMCGGIAGVLSLSIPGGRQAGSVRQALYGLSYNLGRIFSYGLAGTLAAGISFETVTIVSPEAGLLFLRTFSAVVLVSMGLYLAGWFPSFAFIEQAGKPLWRWLEPLTRKLLPLKSPLSALAYGAVWGWLPCGLVYSVLLYSASSGTPLQGGLTMIMFGLGTLPAMLSVTLASRWLLALRKNPTAKQMLGVFVVVLGLASLLYTGSLVGQDCTVCGVQE